MNDYHTRCPVFCIADIPASTLNLLLECSEEYMREFSGDELDISQDIVIMNTKEISSISKGSSLPVDSSPTAFVGHTVWEIRDWFDANITQPRRKGFMRYWFLVLDAQSIEDETCLFVCTLDVPMQSLRCDFDVALQNAVLCEVNGDSFETSDDLNAVLCDINGDSIELEGLMGCYMRSGVIMTKATMKLVCDGGLYIEGGEVKLDQEWRDFSNW
ncbi:hypothetical protein FPV67DRAFT_1657688 [Lyophyllum atratum]|nr:hypothetical protein FPV67DRAFT_1657688 [Lyophyllum atratum]